MAGGADEQAELASHAVADRHFLLKPRKLWIQVAEGVMDNPQIPSHATACLEVLKFS
jgi:hypothetical protein